MYPTNLSVLVSRTQMYLTLYSQRKNALTNFFKMSSYYYIEIILVAHLFLYILLHVSIDTGLYT